MSVGLLEGMLSVIGDEDTDIGGLFSTRLTAAVNVGDTVLPVETTLDWDGSGRLALGGVVYYYTGKTATAFTGITYRDGTTPIPGAYKLHAEGSEVVDLNRSRNAMDKVRRAMLVPYADGEDLTTLARNMGVLRLPFASDDEQFRSIIRGLAYNPKGTMYGLELLLDGLVGNGNYEILEDLINYPCTVFIKLSGDLGVNAVSAGKSYLSDGEVRPAEDQQTVLLEASKNLITVESVMLADVNHEFDMRTQLPSALTITEYPGDNRQAWFYDGTNVEASYVVPSGTLGSEYMWFRDRSGYTLSYRRNTRILPTSKAEWGMVCALDSMGSPIIGPGTAKQWCFYVDDGERRIAWGFKGGSSTNGFINLMDYAAGDWVVLASGSSVLITELEYHDIRVKKNGRDIVELWVDGVRVQTALYTRFNTVSSHEAKFGILDTALGSGFRVKSVDLHVENRVEYWAEREGVVDGAEVDATDLNRGTGLFQYPRDLGRKVRIYDAALGSNGYGGNNNGTWTIVAINGGGASVQLDGVDAAGAHVHSSAPLRVEVPDLKAFTYPDSLGHYLVISDSALGNNGWYIISKILEPDTLVDMGSWRGHERAQSNVCEVVGASFVTEADLTWRLSPNMVNESPVSWEMGGGGDVTDSPPWKVLALPYPYLPFTPVDDDDLIVRVRYTTVLSAQILEDYLTRNSIESEGPPVLYDYYPFYLADPLSYVRSYLDVVTAAGVIPDYALV